MATETDYPAVGKAAAKTALSFLTSAACFFFLFALLRNQKVRNSSYNVYIIFLIWPDAVVNLTSHGMFNMFIAIHDGRDVFPPGYYYVDVWSYFFFYYSNCFLNAVVAYEIHNLVRRSYARQRTSPPSLSRAYTQVTVVYLLASILALFMVLPVPWALFTVTDSRQGKGKLGGKWFDEFTAMGIAFGIMLLPMFYVIYVRWRIWWNRWLPKSGRTRTLSLFFMRILIVFLLFYLPNTLLAAFLGEIPDLTAKYWTSVVMGFLTAGQGLVNLYMVYWKDDIRDAVDEAYCETIGRLCCWWFCCGCGCGNSHKERARRRTKSSESQGSIQISGMSLPLRKESGNQPLSVHNMTRPSEWSIAPTTSDVLPAEPKSIWEEPDVYDESDIERGGDQGTCDARLCQDGEGDSTHSHRHHHQDQGEQEKEEGSHSTPSNSDSIDCSVRSHHSRVDMAGNLTTKLSS